MVKQFWPLPGRFLDVLKLTSDSDAILSLGVQLKNGVSGFTGSL